MRKSVIEFHTISPYFPRQWTCDHRHQTLSSARNCARRHRATLRGMGLNTNIRVRPSLPFENIKSPGNIKTLLKKLRFVTRLTKL